MVVAELKIDSNGNVQLPPEIAQSLGRDPLQLISVSDCHLLVGRQETHRSVLLSGILEAGTIPDVLSYFNMFRKTGILHIDLEGGFKELYFQVGEVVFATSSFAKEELGAVLFSLGKVEREVLQQLRPQVSPTLTIGKLLVEHGAVSPRDLWLAARAQVENIVYNLFAAPQGSFFFSQRAIEQEQLLRLSMSTQNMIMEGLRRLDEKALFMRKIYSFDYYPVETGKVGVDLGQRDALLMELAQSGQLSVRELLRKAGVREFDGLRVLHALIERGLIRMADSPATAVAGDFGRMLGIYNSLFRVICTKLSTQIPDFLTQFGKSLRELPEPYSFILRDVEPGPDGSLDGAQIVANLVGLGEGDKKNLLADALCKVAFMATMIVRRELSLEDAKLLIARVQDVTTQVRSLAGKES
jgi:hypothetical protein